MRWVGTCWGIRGHSVAMRAVLGVRHHWGAASPCLPGARGLAEMGSAPLRGCPGPVGDVPELLHKDITGLYPGCVQDVPLRAPPAPTTFRGVVGGSGSGRIAPYSSEE